MAADPLSGICCVAKIGNRQIFIAHVNDLPRHLDGEETNHGAFSVIRIRDTLRGKRYVSTLYHEVLHASDHALEGLGKDGRLPEAFVLKVGNQMASLLCTIPEIRRRAGFDNG